MQAAVNTIKSTTLTSISYRSTNQSSQLNTNSWTVQQPTAKKNCQVCQLNGACLTGKLDEANTVALCNISRQPAPLHKGEHVYRQNDKFHSIYIVRSGCIKLYQCDQDGEEHIIGFYMPGDIIGSDGISSDRYKNSAMVLDTTSICEIPYGQFEQTIQSYPHLYRAFLNVLCAETYDHQQLLLRLHHKQSEQRLATFIDNVATSFAKRGLSKIEFTLPMHRKDIAQYLGMTEETISRLFSKFQKRGLLSACRRNININDYKGLQQLSLTPN